MLSRVPLYFLDIDDYCRSFNSSRIHLSKEEEYLIPPVIFQNILHTHQKMQNSTVFISFVMVAACCCLLADAAPQDLGSPIRIAQCRALCLDKVNKHLYQLTSPPDKLVKLGKQTESLVYILHTHTHVFIISHLSSCHCFCMLTTALFEFVYFSHRKPVKH